MSQEDLRTLAQNSKLQPLVEPFIEITQEERLKQTEVKIKPPPRLAREDPRSVIPAMFKSGVGIFVLFLVYAATIYAGYEVAIFRARPPALVAGLSAIPFLGMLAPILFLSMPTRLKADETSAVEARDRSESPEEAHAGMQSTRCKPKAAAHPDCPGAFCARGEEKSRQDTPEHRYSAGQYTFNRRFIETKFVNFFGVVRRDAGKDMVLVIKSARGTTPAIASAALPPTTMHWRGTSRGGFRRDPHPFVEISGGPGPAQGRAIEEVGSPRRGDRSRRNVRKCQARGASCVLELSHANYVMSQQFGSFTASELYCPKCGSAQPVRERLLLILPTGELHEFLCTRCASSLGKRTVTGPQVAAPQPAPPRRRSRGPARRLLS